jgi:hypothetical protein
MRWMILSAALLATSGCAAGGNFCDVASPIYYPSPEARNAVFAYPDLDRDIIAHNQKGQKLCGW